MARSKLRLDTRRALKDGTYPVQIVVGYGTNLYLSTHIFISPEDWDETTQRVVGKSARRMNTILDTLLTRVANRILDLRESGQWLELSKPQLREMLLNLELESPTVDMPTIGSMFDLIMKQKEGRRRSGFQSALNKLQRFCDPYKVGLEEINRNWLDKFMASMDDIGHNSRSLYMSQLFYVLNYAVEEGLTKNNISHTYKIPRKKETTSRALPLKKMQAIANMEFHEKYREARDMFMLSFFLIGINNADMAKLTRENIVNGRLEYYRAKTGKLYSIKLEPEARALIRQYRGDRLLLYPFERYTNYSQYTQFEDNLLHELGPTVNMIGFEPITKPIERRLTSYWARHTWATLAAELDIPRDTISEALGHSYGAPVTGVYIKFNHDKIDEANRRVIDLVLKK